MDAHMLPALEAYLDYSAIRAQEQIIEQFLGYRLPEGYLLDAAKAHGWYQEGHGIRMADVGRLLELHHIPRKPLRGSPGSLCHRGRRRARTLPGFAPESAQVANVC